MAYMDPDAILTAVRDVIQEAHGNSRTITANTYEGDLYAALAKDEQSRRALVKPRAEARIVSVARHEASPPVKGNLGLYAIEIEVLLIRHLNFEHRTGDAARDDVRALAVRDADVLRQALEYPGNVTQTAGGTNTGLVSGMLRYVDSDVGDVELADGDPGLVTTTHTFTGTVKVTF